MVSLKSKSRMFGNQNCLYKRASPNRVKCLNSCAKVKNVTPLGFVWRVAIL